MNWGGGRYGIRGPAGSGRQVGCDEQDSLRVVYAYFRTTQHDVRVVDPGPARAGRALTLVQAARMPTACLRAGMILGDVQEMLQEARGGPVGNSVSGSGAGDRSGALDVELSETRRWAVRRPTAPR